jgi:hypothetical protein
MSDIGLRSPDGVVNRKSAGSDKEAVAQATVLSRSSKREMYDDDNFTNDFTEDSSTTIHAAKKSRKVDAGTALVTSDGSLSASENFDEHICAPARRRLRIKLRFGVSPWVLSRRNLNTTVMSDAQVAAPSTEPSATSTTTACPSCLAEAAAHAWVHTWIHSRNIQNGAELNQTSDYGMAHSPYDRQAVDMQYPALHPDLVQAANVHHESNAFHMVDPVVQLQWSLARHEGSMSMPLRDIDVKTLNPDVPLQSIEVQDSQTQPSSTLANLKEIPELQPDVSESPEPLMSPATPFIADQQLPELEEESALEDARRE